MVAQMWSELYLCWLIHYCNFTTAAASEMETQPVIRSLNTTTTVTQQLPTFIE